MKDYRLFFKSFGDMSFLELVKENKQALEFLLNYSRDFTIKNNGDKKK